MELKFTEEMKTTVTDKLRKKKFEQQHYLRDGWTAKGCRGFTQLLR